MWSRHLSGPPLLCDTHNSLCTSKRLEELYFLLFHHLPPSLGAAGVRGHRDAHLGISQTPGERGAGLPSAVGVGFCFSVHLAHYLRPPGTDFSDYREPQVNLIRFDGPQARKGASVKFAPASLLLRICGLCGHRCTAHGEVNRPSRLNDCSKKP